MNNWIGIGRCIVDWFVLFISAHIKSSSQIDAATQFAYRHMVAIHFGVAHHLHVGLLVDVDATTCLAGIVEVDDSVF